MVDYESVDKCGVVDHFDVVQCHVICTKDGLTYLNYFCILAFCHIRRVTSVAVKHLVTMALFEGVCLQYLSH